MVRVLQCFLCYALLLLAGSYTAWCWVVLAVTSVSGACCGVWRFSGAVHMPGAAWIVACLVGLGGAAGAGVAPVLCPALAHFGALALATGAGMLGHAVRGGLAGWVYASLYL
jgi:hypothetical protein